MAEGQVSQFSNITFTDMPIMRPIGLKRQSMLMEFLTITWLPRGDRLTHQINIPPGFIHNGPSIPNRLRGIVYYTHRLLRPSIVHDYLYSGYGAKHGWTRKEADRLFLESLLAEGVGIIRRRVMWLAVRALGNAHFKR